MEGCDLGIDAGASVVLKLGIVLVKPGEGAIGGRIFEIGLIEILFGECGKGLRGGVVCPDWAGATGTIDAITPPKTTSAEMMRAFVTVKSYNSRICNSNAILLRRYFFQLEFVEQEADFHEHFLRL